MNKQTVHLPVTTCSGYSTSHCERAISTRLCRARLIHANGPAPAFGVVDVVAVHPLIDTTWVMCVLIDCTYGGCSYEYVLYSTCGSVSSCLFDV